MDTDYVADTEYVVNKAIDLNGKAYEYAKSSKWFDVDESECEIRYMTGNTKYYWSLLCCGLRETLMKQEHNITERKSIRKTAKSYYKLFYKDGKLIKVENYNYGLKGYYLFYYYDDVRVLMPFDVDKTNAWWHYCIVTWFNSHGVEKEVWIDEKGLQVIYTEYDYSEKEVRFETANCVPRALNEKYRIHYFYRGVL
ncbi:MAG: hypothetical protein HFK08_06405 [Clostridia bacterium]|nr:hypothetical protein [Clostridia bacterium]